MNNTQKTILIYFLLLWVSKEMIACTCGLSRLSEKQKWAIENSECIFIGEVFEIDKHNQTYKIRVSESLDGGDTPNNIYLGKNWKTCTPYINEEGKWIVYGSMEDGFLRLNLCGISRSFNYPVIYPTPPPPPELNEKPKSKIERKNDYQKRKEKNIEKGLAELNAEIDALRKLRDKKQ
ncbi:hypothetical protein [Aquimarina intermedia]|uniref:Tissue inhibitor of metalloproteinase n=1 Tax=Aquimarina intermedia TaxID=350814 RepID=A0A5S5C0H9_9FLAO|nr:hypothetical protein [Aquimarina intermedia]TYP72118.1 hypothetical protein BD809_1072 [Aquimarina intermedia]